MKADIMTWAQLAAEGAEGKVVLTGHPHQSLMTVRKLGEIISSGVGDDRRYVDVTTAWGEFRTFLARDDHLVAVVESGNMKQGE